MRRIHTRDGIHPYDEVTWERRDVVMTNWRDGSVNFEQRGVEFPDFWSVNAANIVTTKYFRGAVGTPQREWSLKQLDRPGRRRLRRRRPRARLLRHDKDAEIFEHELKYALVHQIFSFNSPVWFNVGTASPQQVSACFILAVDDTMDSILEWYREEGLIFKGGSGAGRQPLPDPLQQGTAVPPAAPPAARSRSCAAPTPPPGTIKSGGATRRAAKMVVLDVDHPDVEEFIETKAREEDKIRVLRDAGFDMDLGGKDITSVQYQNANNSVRVSDEFMRAVEAGGDVRPARPPDRRGRRAGRRQGPVPQDGQGRLGVRRPRHPVRRHDQRLAHLPGVRPDHRQQPVLGVRPPGQLVLQPGQHQPAEVPARRRHVRRREVPGDHRADHHGDGHLDLLRRLPDREDRRDHPRLPPARHRLRQPRRAADGHRPRLRLRRRPGDRRRDHLADDRHRVPALGRAGRRRRAV